MDVTTLIASIIVLSLLLLVLVLVYIRGSRRHEKTGAVAPAAAQPRQAVKAKRTLDALEAVVLNRNSSKDELRDAVTEIAAYYGQVHATTLARYSHIIVALCRHPQTDKNIVIDFDKALRSQNPAMRRELDMALQKGLNSR